MLNAEWRVHSVHCVHSGGRELYEACSLHYAEAAYHTADQVLPARDLAVAWAAVQVLSVVLKLFHRGGAEEGGDQGVRAGRVAAAAVPAVLQGRV